MIAQRISLLLLLLAITVSDALAAPPADSNLPQALPREDGLLYRKVPVPEPFLTTQNGHTFGGDIRIGDFDGDDQCDLLVYRCNHGAPSGAHMGGLKPCFMGAFRLDGSPIWHAGQGGNQPSRPMSVAAGDMTGDGAADIVCFWHKPSSEVKADWRSLADIVVQIRDGRTGEVLRQAAPRAITGCRMKDPGGSNWVHQRLLLADFRGTGQPHDVVIKLGDTYVALDENLDVLWTYRSRWIRYSECPAYIPAVGDMDGDGRDELNGGYFVLDDDGTPLWEKKLGRNMDSVVIAPWNTGKMRAFCSGFGHIMAADGNVILALGAEEVPHGQEVRVANFRGDLPGPEMVLRHKGHTADLLVVSSTSPTPIVDRLQLNFSPTNVGMEPVYWNGPDRPALLCNGGWLWDLEQKTGYSLPALPDPNGNKVHRMGFYHAIPANVCGDTREELVLWDPTARHVYVYTPEPLNESAYSGYQAGPRQYNPRLMD